MSKSGERYHTALQLGLLASEKQSRYIETCKFPILSEIGRYERVAKIGQGTFGEVFKARDRHEKSKLKFVALKKVLIVNEMEGFPLTAIREIKILQLLKHENVINLIDVCHTKATKRSGFRSLYFLVFDFCDHDLAGLLQNKDVQFSLSEIKNIIKQLLSGLFYIHTNKILHRDIKAANILITKQGILKIADFGLARPFSIRECYENDNAYTNRVVTLWYRPPELLLGERNYGPAIDMWGAGCILAEMWTRTPIMQGNSEKQQLQCIMELCGSIKPDIWPDVINLPLYKCLELPQHYKRSVIPKLRPFIQDKLGCDLLDKLLELNPGKRYTAENALNHEFLWSDPMPGDLSKTLSHYCQSMFDYFASSKRPKCNFKVVGEDKHRR